MTKAQEIQIEKLRGKKFEYGGVVYTVRKMNAIVSWRDEVLCADSTGQFYGFLVTDLLNITEWVK